MTLLSNMENLNPAEGTAWLWFLGGSSFGVRFNDRPLVFLDLDHKAGLEGLDVPADGFAPSLRLLRVSSLPFDPSEITAPAAYLSTHADVDHCDRDSVLAVTRRGGLFVGPSSSCDLAADWGVNGSQIRKLEGRNFEMTRFHDIEIWSAPNTDPGSVSSNSFVLQHDGISIFHNGDSRYDGRMYLQIASRFKIDVAIINLGRNPKGRDWYHSPCDVARAANDLEPRFLLSHHYDKWDKTQEDPTLVGWALKNLYPEALKKTEYVILRPGDPFKVPAIE
jgi:L-ascorbate metabolism protein UlaG (beta-lactamase superfamily)